MVAHQLIPGIIIYKCVHSHMHANSFFLFNSMITVRPFSTNHCIHTHTQSYTNQGTFLIVHNPGLMDDICVYIAHIQNDAMHTHVNYTIGRDKLTAKKELEYRS